MTAKSTTSLQPHGNQSHFRLTVVLLYMYVRRLAAIASIEEETQGADSQNCGHKFLLTSWFCQKPT